VDGITKQFAINLEKQLSEYKSALQTSNHQNLQFQQQLNERAIAFQGLKSQMAEITGNLQAKDNIILSIKKAHRDVETEVEQLRVRSTELDKELRDWKSRGSQNRQQETDMLRVSTLFYSTYESSC
jgi:chromosome segregation ATPase